MQMHGRVCLVTGASSGIGRVTAAHLARAGAVVVAAGRNRAALQELAGATGVHPLIVDLSDPAGPRELVEAVEADHGPVDVLVQSAGVGLATPFVRNDADRIRAVLDLDLTAPILLAREVLPGMLERGRGRIVLVGSIVGHTGNRDEAVYGAAKSGLVGFARSLRVELAGTGVGVSVVSPGAVDTPFFAHRGAPYARRWPMPVDPDRVAAAILRAIERGRTEVFVPGWLRVPARMAGAAPAAFAAAQARAT
jgi:uncharacterized protein